MKTADAIKLGVAALLVVCAGAYVMSGSGTKDPDDFITVDPEQVDEAKQAEKRAELERQQQKTQKKPAARVGEDIG